mmetsp:Transcript_9240/g.10773  ORF Transcript_9240/g.10773 Transcript_9240/m.10773 type:complete len:89 (-) Transcript_9240:147-413(-)
MGGGYSLGVSVVEQQKRKKESMILTSQSNNLPNAHHHHHIENQNNNYSFYIRHNRTCVYESRGLYACLRMINTHLATAHTHNPVKIGI